MTSSCFSIAWVALSLRAGTRGEPYDVVFAGWSVDYADPASFFVPLLHGDSLAPTGNLNFAYLDDLMRGNPPWAPAFNFLRRHFISRSFGCYFFHPVYLLDIAAACKK